MKIIKLKYCFFFLFAIPSIVFSQLFPKLDKYNLTQVKGQVNIDIRLSSGSICNGIDVYRSTDSINFVYIGGIPGFCGSFDVPTDYQYTDEKPIVNATNYYYLDFGGLGTSPIQSINIIGLNQSGYRLSPNPSNSNVSLYFNNSRFSEFELFLYNTHGQIVLQQKTNLDFINLNVSHLFSGIYSFSLLDKSFNQTIIGRLIVQH